MAADRHLTAPIVSIHADYVFIRDNKRELFVNLYSQYTPYLGKGQIQRNEPGTVFEPGPGRKYDRLWLSISWPK